MTKEDSESKSATKHLGDCDTAMWMCVIVRERGEEGQNQRSTVDRW